MPRSPRPSHAVQVVSTEVELVTGRSPEAPGSEITKSPDWAMEGTGTAEDRPVRLPAASGGFHLCKPPSASLRGLCSPAGFARTSDSDPERPRANPREREGAGAVELNPLNHLGRVRPTVTGTVTYCWSSAVHGVAEPGSIPPNMLKTLCEILINTSGSCWGLYQSPRALRRVNGLSSPRGDHEFTQLSEALQSHVAQTAIRLQIFLQDTSGRESLIF